jgi:hypothetical protein
MATQTVSLRQSRILRACARLGRYLSAFSGTLDLLAAEGDL